MCYGKQIEINRWAMAKPAKIRFAKPDINNEGSKATLNPLTLPSTLMESVFNVDLSTSDYK